MGTAIVAPHTVAKATAELQDLYDNALSPDFSESHMGAALERANGLDKAQLAEVVAGAGFNQKFASKTASIAALRKWVLGRKGTHERSGA